MANFQEKALAEKNMRDMLAQREQAEKHVRQLSYRSPGRDFFAPFVNIIYSTIGCSLMFDTEIG